MPAGRPTKLSPETQKKICDGIRLGMTRERAAEWAGICRSTFFNWIRRGEEAESGVFSEFLYALKRAESDGIAVCLNNIHKAAKGEDYNGQWQAAAWILERRHPMEYGKQVAVDVDVSRKMADAVEKLEIED